MKGKGYYLLVQLKLQNWTKWLASWGKNLYHNACQYMKNNFYKCQTIKN